MTALRRSRPTISRNLNERLLRRCLKSCRFAQTLIRSICRKLRLVRNFRRCSFGKAKVATEMALKPYFQRGASKSYYLNLKRADLFRIPRCAVWQLSESEPVPGSACSMEKSQMLTYAQC